MSWETTILFVYCQVGSQKKLSCKQRYFEDYRNHSSDTTFIILVVVCVFLSITEREMEVIVPFISSPEMVLRS